MAGQEQLASEGRELEDSNFKQMRDHLRAQLALCRKAFDTTLKSGDPQFARPLGALFYALNDSSESALMRAESDHMRDLAVVTRTIFETSLNICFISASGAEAAERAHRHAVQKFVRDTERESTVGGQTIRLKWTGAIPENDEITTAIEQFSTKSGAEVRDWTPDNLTRRLELVRAVLGERVLTLLHWPMIAVYRHSSEVVHGTLFGAMWARGIEVGALPPDRRSVLRKLRAQSTMFLQMSAFCLIASLHAANHRIPLADLLNRSEALMAALHWIE